VISRRYVPKDGNIHLIAAVRTYILELIDAKAVTADILHGVLLLSPVFLYAFRYVQAVHINCVHAIA
jgi:hypothetical protein